MGRVLPWRDFKKDLLIIYESRIHYSEQINGFLNSNYLSMEEFLLIYFLKNWKLRRLSEIKLIDFISSLKCYHTKKLVRAKVFSTICGLYSVGEVNETDSCPHSCDIYLQEYSLFLYKLLFTDQRDFIEDSNEERTLMKIDRAESMIDTAVPWIGEGRQMFVSKMRRDIVTIAVSCRKRMLTDEMSRQYSELR